MLQSFCGVFGECAMLVYGKDEAGWVGGDDMGCGRVDCGGMWFLSFIG